MYARCFIEHKERILSLFWGGVVREGFLEEGTQDRGFVLLRSYKRDLGLWSSRNSWVWESRSQEVGSH